MSIDRLIDNKSEADTSVSTKFRAFNHFGT